MSRLNKYLKFEQVQWTVLAAGLVLTFCVAGTYVFKPAYFKLLENKLYDVFVVTTHSKLEKSHVAIVDIDESSLERFGQWPWPRYRVALLLKKIQMAGALAVGSDILFGEPDGTSPAVIKKTLRRDLHIDVAFKGVPDQLMDHDQLFADVLKTGPFILGYSFFFRQNARNERPAKGLPPLNPAQVKEKGAVAAHNYMIPAAGVIPPLPLFQETAVSAGFMNTLTDADGVLRRVPLMISWKGKIYPHLSLATLLAAVGTGGGTPVLKVTRGGIESLRVQNTVIPLEPDGAMLVNYKGPGHTYPYLSAGDVLQDSISGSILANKVVFLGSSAAGLMDIRVSPLDEVFPGVEVNATIVDNILNRDFIHRPDWIPGLELFLILFWGISITLLIGWANAGLTLVITIMLGTSAWYSAFWFLKTYQVWVSPFFPLLVLGGNFALLNLFNFWLSERKKKFYRRAFSKYVSKAVVDQISASPEKMSLEGEEKEVSILFADIRSFTSISERLSPTQVTMLLHDYFTPVTRSIIANHGTLDKFIGDAVMCFWNAPLDVPDHPAQAVKTGFEMLSALEKLNVMFQEKYGIAIAIGIGIHSGTCRVGNMGSDDLFDYTIIGDNVNLASRLEGLTKFYGVELIVSGAVVAAFSHHLLAQELDRVRVKGKKEPVVIYTLHQPPAHQRPSLQAELSHHERGMAAYRNRQFREAKDLFKRLQTQYLQRKIYDIYIERCDFFVENPPGKDWDGVFTHQTK